MYLVLHSSYNWYTCSKMVVQNVEIINMSLHIPENEFCLVKKWTLFVEIHITDICYSTEQTQLKRKYPSNKFPGLFLFPLRVCFESDIEDPELTLGRPQVDQEETKSEPKFSKQTHIISLPKNYQMPLHVYLEYSSDRLERRKEKGQVYFILQCVKRTTRAALD